MGVLSWAIAGFLSGVVGAIVPGPRLVLASWLQALTAAVLGALLGGLLATVLGFGGFAAFDPRSLLVALLGATLLLLVWRLRRSAKVAASRLP